MKTENRIIVLIDFTKNSGSLVDFAFSISGAINAKIVFIHRIPGLSPAMTDQITKDEIIRSESEEALEKLRIIVGKRVDSNNTLYVSKKSIPYILSEISSDKFFDWVITGLKGSGPIQRLVKGSTVVSVVNESGKIIVAAPTHKQLQVPTKLVIGIKSLYPLNKNYFDKMLSSLKNQIDELFFFTILKKGQDQEKAEKYLIKLQEEYKDHNSRYQLFYENNTLNILKENIEMQKAFLVLQKGPRSIGDQLFRKFMINEFIYNGNFPLIVLPNDMEM